MDSKPLVIAYSGSLDAYDPSGKKSAFKRLLQWFWTYKHDTVDASTRSAYYLIKALKILKNQHSITPAQIQFDFWGKINPLNRNQAENEGVLEFFQFGTYLPKQESLRRLDAADTLFLPLEMSNSKESGTLFIPGKLYEYLNAGKPVLALCEPSDCRDILESSGLGICVEPNKPEAIALKLLEILKDKSILAQTIPNRDYISQYDFRVKTKQLAQVFDSLY